MSIFIPQKGFYDESGPGTGIFIPQKGFFEETVSGGGTTLFHTTTVVAIGNVLRSEILIATRQAAVTAINTALSSKLLSAFITVPVTSIGIVSSIQSRIQQFAIAIQEASLVSMDVKVRYIQNTISSTTTSLLSLIKLSITNTATGSIIYSKIGFFFRTIPSSATALSTVSFIGTILKTVGVVGTVIANILSSVQTPPAPGGGSGNKVVRYIQSILHRGMHG